MAAARLQLEPIDSSLLSETALAVAEAAAAAAAEEERRLALEVMALPDIVPAPATAAEVRPTERVPVAERLARRRKERHDATLRELALALELIQDELGQRVRAAAIDCRKSIDSWMAKLDAVLAPVCNPELLIAYSIEQLDAVDAEAARIFDHRRAAVDDMTAALATIEADRRECLATTLCAHGKALVSIAHQLRPDVERTLFDKAKEINNWILDNQVAAVELRTQLMTREITSAEGTKNQLTLLRLRWRELRQTAAAETLAKDLSDESMVAKAQAAALDGVGTAWSSICAALSKQFECATSLKPANCADDSLEARTRGWRQETEAAVLEWTESQGRLTASLRLDLEDWRLVLDNQTAKCQLQLIQEGVCDASEVSALILPIAERIRPGLESAAEHFATTLEDKCAAKSATVAAVTRNIIAYVEQSVRTWNTFTSTEADERANYFMQISALRQAVEAERNPLDSKIEGQIDGLRHAESAEALATQQAEMQSIHNMVAATFLKFGASANTLIDDYHKRSKAVVSGWADIVEDFVATKPKLPSDVESASKVALIDVLDTDHSGGVTKQEYDAVFGTDSDVTEKKQKDLISRYASDIAAQFSVDLNSEINSTAVAMLDAFNAALHGAVSELQQEQCRLIDEFCVAEKEGVTAELEIQKSMHDAKVNRIEEAVLNVRKAELVLHRNRVGRHCRGLDAALEEENVKFIAVQDEVRRRSEKFTKQLGVVTTSLEGIKDGLLLTQAHESAAELTEAFRLDIRKYLQQYRQTVDDSLRGYRESNGVLRTSFRTFTEGGNFSTHEIQMYKEVLVALGTKIDEIEGRILEVLNMMEGEQVNAAEQAMQRCTERYDLLHRDLNLWQSAANKVRSMQIMLKAEIGKCNSQSAEIDEVLEQFKSQDTKSISMNTVTATCLRLVRLIRDRVEVLGALKPVAGSKPEERERGTTVPKSRSRYGQKNMPVLQEWSTTNKGSFMCAANELRVNCRESICSELAIPYYDDLHGKVPARSDLIPETIQPFIDGFEKELCAVHSKTEAYHQQCVTELADQIATASALIRKIVPPLFEQATDDAVQRLEVTMQGLSKKYDHAFKMWVTAGEAALRSLRPALGHPSNAAKLDALISQEASRHDGIEENVRDGFVATEAELTAVGGSCVQYLTEMRGNLFDACADLVEESDIWLHAKAKKKSLKAMLKGRTLGVDVANVASAGETDCDTMTRQLPSEREWSVITVGSESTANIICALDTAMNREFDSLYVSAATRVAANIATRVDKAKLLQRERLGKIERAQAEWEAAVNQVKAQYT